MKSYAIVSFPDEKDDVSIVCTNWIDYSKNMCYYPIVKTTAEKRRLLAKKVVPTEYKAVNWLECKIRIFKEYSTIEIAKAHIGEAEVTSHLSSEDEEENQSKRIRRYPSSDSENEPPKKINHESYPIPPAVEILTQKISSPIQTPTSSRPPSQIDVALCSLESTLQTPTRTQQAERYRSLNDELLYDVLNSQGRISDQLNRLESTLNELKTAMPFYGEKSNGPSQTEDKGCIDMLPLTIENFENFNQNLQSRPGLKQRLVRILQAAPGNTTKSYIANILRKLLTDEAAEKISLTGKRLKNGTQKIKFEGTELFKITIELTFKIYKDAKEALVREAISDWLMQSKFRRNRREARRAAFDGIQAGGGEEEQNDVV